MSWWPGSGRYSPFTSFYGTRSAPPQVTEDDYSYIGENDDSMRHNSYGYPSGNHSASYQPTHYRHGSSGSQRMEPVDIAPDQIILKHKGTTYPLHFEAFSISEGDLKVRDLRRAAARELRVDDPRRVKLLYKGKQMRDNDVSCKRENLKQNSEVMCVVSAEPGLSDSESEGSDSVATSGDFPRDGERRKKRKNHRGGKKKNKEPSSDPTSAAPASGNLAPPSEPRAQTSRTASPSARKPVTADEMMADIQSNFDVNFKPKAEQYLANPPADQKTRQFEYSKLSETILTQVLMKVDDVDTQGDDTLRAKRRELVNKIQGVLTQLDKVGKPK